MNSADTTLVTGATGQVGSQVALLLAKKGRAVRAFVRNREKAAPLEAAGVALAAGDLSDPEALQRAMDGVTSLMVISPATPDMPDLQSRLVESAEAAGVRRIVKLSATGANAKSDVNVARWHGQVENRISGSGIAHTFLRPSGFMQNLFGLSRYSKTGGSFPTHRTTGRETMIDNRDVAACAVAVLSGDDSHHHTYELSGPESLTIDQVAAAVSEVAGTNVTPNRISEDEYRAMMIGYAVPEWVVNDMIAWGHLEQDPTGDVEKLTGRPATPLKKFLQDHVNVFRA